MDEIELHRKQELGDFLRFAGAVLGLVKDAALNFGWQCGKFAIRAAMVSVAACATALLFVLASESSGWTFLNLIAVTICSVVAIFWAAMAQIIIEFGAQLQRLDFVRRITSRVGGVALACFVLVISVPHFPPGIAGLKGIGILLLFLLGTFLLGLRVTKRAVGLKLILVSLLAGAHIVFPQSLSSLAVFLTGVDRSIAESITPDVGELEISLELLDGAAGPRLFLNGIPQWWCRKAPEAAPGYRCFDEEGSDPITNEGLVPISSQIVLEMRERLIREQERLERARADAQARALREAEEAERERKKREQQARVELDRRKAEEIAEAQEEYIQKYGSARDSQSELGLSIVVQGRLHTEFSAKLSTLLLNKTTTLLLNDAAVRDGVFDELYSGSTEVASRLRISESVDKLLLGNLILSFADNPAIKGVTNATASFATVLIDTATGESKRFESSATGLGRSKFAAQQKAEDLILEELVGFLNDA